MKLFISYSRKDQEFANRLASQLSASGFRTWIDERIQGGQQFDAEILGAMRRSQIVLVVISESAVKSEWVSREVKYAVNLGKRIIPVMWQATPLPDMLQRRHYIDFTSRFESGFDSLKASILAPVPFRTKLRERPGTWPGRWPLWEGEPNDLWDQLIFFILGYWGLFCFVFGLGVAFGFAGRSVSLGVAAAVIGSAAAYIMGYRKIAGILGTLVTVAISIVGVAQFTDATLQPFYTEVHRGRLALLEQAVAFIHGYATWFNPSLDVATTLRAQFGTGMLLGWVGPAFAFGGAVLRMRLTAQDAVLNRRSRLGRLAEFVDCANRGFWGDSVLWVVTLIIAWLWPASLGAGYGLGQDWAVGVAGFAVSYGLCMGVISTVYLCLLAHDIDLLVLIPNLDEFFTNIGSD